jgi:hypothetical protein
MERDLAEANTRLRELNSLDAANRGLREEVGNVGALSLIRDSHFCQPSSTPAHCVPHCLKHHSCETCKKGLTGKDSQCQPLYLPESPMGTPHLRYSISEDRIGVAGAAQQCHLLRTPMRLAFLEYQSGR